MPFYDLMAKNITIEEFNGAHVAFRADAWVNATQMAKPFQKRPAKFLELPSTSAFMGALAKDIGAVSENRTALVLTESGGVNGGGGTWMHPDLAMEFARWLSPEFAIWTNRVIRRLLTPVPTVAPDFATAMVDAIKTLTAKVAAIEAREMPEPVPAPQITSRQAWIAWHVVRNMPLDVPSVAYAVGIPVTDLYALMRLRALIEPGRTTPTRRAIAWGDCLVLDTGKRTERTLITPRGITSIMRSFGIPVPVPAIAFAPAAIPA